MPRSLHQLLTTMPNDIAARHIREGRAVRQATKRRGNAADSRLASKGQERDAHAAGTACRASTIDRRACASHGRVVRVSPMVFLVNDLAWLSQFYVGHFPIGERAAHTPAQTARVMAAALQA